MQADYLDLNIVNEYAPLKSVVLGIADQPGDLASADEAYDPKSKLHLQNGTFPKTDDLLREMDFLNKTFEKHNVTVFRPINIPNVNQIFSRDISFVIENKLFQTNIIEDRQEEIKGIEFLLKKLNPKNIVQVPEGVFIEGGDVIIHNDFIFIGYSEEADFDEFVVSRTNKLGVEFIRQHFPNKKVMGFELQKSDTDPFYNALHLDCCFQPLGKGKALMFDGGFKNVKDVEWLTHYFGKSNIIFTSRQEMYDMGCNVFSISDEVIISEKNFTRINEQLQNFKFHVEEVPYYEVSKMEGLFRCSTLPLYRA